MYPEIGSNEYFFLILRTFLWYFLLSLPWMFEQSWSSSLQDLCNQQSFHWQKRKNVVTSVMTTIIKNHWCTVLKQSLKKCFDIMAVIGILCVQIPSNLNLTWTSPTDLASPTLTSPGATFPVPDYINIWTFLR